MRARRNEFGDAEIVVVTFSDPRVLAGYRRRFAEPFRVVSDQHLQLYSAFGFGRGSVRRIWGWRAARQYIKLLRAGKKLERTTDDTLQLGGDVVADREGHLRWIYPGAGPDDRPSVDDILRAVRSLE